MHVLMPNIHDVQEISKFLRNPHKPAILAMSRPDPKKNITTLVKAFGENKTLRGLANLVLIMVSLTPASFALAALQSACILSCSAPATVYHPALRLLPRLVPAF